MSVHELPLRRGAPARGEHEDRGVAEVAGARRGGEAAAPDSPEALRSRALRLLARREHTRSELARKLAPHADGSEAVNALLEALVARGKLSEARFAEARVHTLSRKYGSVRIRRDLRARGVPDAEIERAAASTTEDELARARAIVERRYRARPAAADAAERAKRMRFLLGRGFSSEVARRALAPAQTD